MIERHLTRLRIRHGLSEAEEQVIRSLVADTRTIPARTIFIREGERLDHSALLLDGFVGRNKDLPDGERQITEVGIPGDFVDMHGFTLKRLDHNVQALSESVVALVPHERLLTLMDQHPRLTRLYWFGTSLDAAIHREWQLSLGRRSAMARVATLFCELNIRLGLVGLTEPDGFKLPLTQTDLSECLGLTPVHVNRTLRQLREQKLAWFQRGYVRLLDEPGLRALAGFEDDYLYLPPNAL